MPSPETKNEQSLSSSSSSAFCTIATTASIKEKNTTEKFKVIEGCQKCGRDDDHPNLLLCEACNDEYHIYCLDPPLYSVPDGDFFCHKCKPHLQIFVNNNDELDKRVSSLPPLFTQRFGEIIWAYGGQGFGWWPACVYDPRLTVGGARKSALKHLGKKHLVYFFGCPDAPFTCLPDNKCMAWDDGLMEDFDGGRVAKNVGKNRSQMFEWALQAAIAENQKPIEFRLDWNHEEDPFITGVGGGGATVNEANNKKRSIQQNDSQEKDQKKQRSNSTAELVATRRSNRCVKPSSIMASIQDQKETEKKLKKIKKPSSSLNDQNNQHQVISHPKGAKTNRQSIDHAMISTNVANQIEETFDSDSNEDDTFFCKILRKVTEQSYVNNKNGISSPTTASMVNDVNIGFITLSKKSSTFADARKKILSEFDEDMLLFPTHHESTTATPNSNKRKMNNWKFYIPYLGPMSKKQESKFGSMYDMLTKNGDGRIGNGSIRHPLKVIIYNC